MRRFAVATLLVLFIAQSSGIAVAENSTSASPNLSWSEFFASLRSAIAWTIGAQSYVVLRAPMTRLQQPEHSVDAVTVMRSRRPLLPRPRPGIPQILRLPDRSVLTSRERIRDPRAMRRPTTSPKSLNGDSERVTSSVQLSVGTHGEVRPPSGALGGTNRGNRIKQALGSNAGTGVEHWWTYEEQPIPGIGKASLNVGTGNLVVSAMDVNVPEQGINLAFQRVYNSQSLHDTNKDDGGDPAIFGNGWTNNLDANIVYNGTTITVYDLDGTPCIYTPDGNGGWIPCTGEHAQLALVGGQNGCTYTWTKPNGTVYVFMSDGGNLGLCNSQTLAGHLVEIISRNTNNYITFTYYWDSTGQKTSEHIAEIDADHSDGDKLILTFGIVPGTSWNELSTIERPDQSILQYRYDSSGDLLEVDKPGNNSAATLTNIPYPPKDWQQGDLPESYAYASGYQLEEACGPRCTASTWANGTPKDGAAITFQFVNAELSQWQVQGVLNFTPDDGTGVQLNATAQAGWKQWNTTNFQYGGSGVCGSSGSSTTYMCDGDGHQTIWATDSSARVTQTKRLAGSQFITTQQAWDTSNNLISTTDANGNLTQYGYDPNTGNMVETQLPNATDFTINGIPNKALMPLSFYSYDSTNNVVAYCDPYWTNANNKIWKPNPTSSMCPSTQGTTYFAYNYDQTNEPYGCMTDMNKPGGYHTKIKYGVSSDCALGLPSLVQGDIITQFPGQPSRRPTQDFIYSPYGQLTQYDRGQATGSDNYDSWTLSYNQNGNHDNLNTERTENDSTIGTKMNSFTCYYPDGSVFYTETPAQHNADNQPCPTTVSLLAGPVSPPAQATAHYYDYDGDEVKSISHKGCSSNNSCSSTNTTKTECTSAEGQQPIGTTCKYYDGLDRLVETAQPYDDRSFSDGKQFEFYSFRWMNRYIYDLSLSGANGSLTIGDSQGSTHSFAAYGNLYKTQEYLPQLNKMRGCYAATLSCQTPGRYTSASWSDVRGTSFDSLDRPVNKYELAYGTGYVTSNSYDGSGQAGQLSSVVNAMGQTTTYTYDNIARVKQVQFTSGDGDTRSYQYDPDGRTASVTGVHFGQISYTYDVDGNELTVTEPTKQQGYDGGSFICYEYYGDGMREYLTVGSAGGNYSNCSQVPDQGNPGNDGISQYRLMAYAYSGDGHLSEQDTAWGSTQSVKKFSWAYAPSGREISETDPVTGNYAVAPNGSRTHLTAKAYTYAPDGRANGLTLPGQFQQSSLIYDEDDELAGYTAGIAGGQGQGITRSLTLNARGELLQDGIPNALYQFASAQLETQSGNGAQVGNGDYPFAGSGYQLPPTTTEYDLRSNMVLCSTDPTYAQDYPNLVYPFVFKYDAAGRQTNRGSDKTTQNSTTCDPSKASDSTYTYDAENHLQSISGIGSINVTWGPDGRQRIDNLGGSGTQTAHWDGDTLLFATGGGTSPQLYIGKSAVMGYAGDLDVYDRDQTGAKVSSHGYATINGSYWLDGWSVGSVRSIQVQKSGQLLNLQLFTGTCNAYFTIGQNTTYYPCPPIGATFEMTRADGYKMVGGIVQGTRTFDSTSGQWLTPDAYAGDVNDPISQKPFIWNGNNPLQFNDPTGYTIDWNSMSPDVFEAITNLMAASPTFENEINTMENDSSNTYEFAQSSNDLEGNSLREGSGEIGVGGGIVEMLASTATSGDELEATFAHEGSHGADFAEGIFYSLSSQTVPNSVFTQRQEPNNLAEAHAYIETDKIMSEAFGNTEAGTLLQQTLPFWSGANMPPWSIQEITNAYCVANNPGC